MLKLLLDHDYDRPVPAVDRSQFSNHGRVIGASFAPDGARPGSGALLFGAPGSAVRVAWRPSWARLNALLVEAWIRVEPKGVRHNVVEGDGSFALFVDDDGSLVGSIFGYVDGAGSPAWNTVSSGTHSPDGVPQRVPASQWCKLTFQHDGLTRARLFIDERLVGARGDYRSGVIGVASAGVVIGNWTLAEQYAFSGAIDRVRVWCRDELAPLDQLAARPISPAARDRWDEIWACLAASLDPERRRELGVIRRAWEDLVRRFVRAVHAAGTVDHDELRRIIDTYRTNWWANTIDDPSQGDAMVALLGLIDRLLGPAWVQDAQDLARDVVRVFGGEACIDPKRIAACDPQIVSFLADTAARLSDPSCTTPKGRP
jgi:hypothetical protein